MIDKHIAIILVILAFIVAGGIIVKKDYRHYDSAPIETVK